jgi:dipeptidyl aminopeptidase/acylaminoacyl peptidase
VPSFAAPDRLVYRRNKTLYAQTFDPAAARLSGEPQALIEASLPVGFMASPSLSAAGPGVLAYVPQVDVSTSLVMFEIDGVQGETVPLPAGQFTDIRISPDGTRVATSRNDRDNSLSAGSDIWLVDLSRKGGSRVTFDPQFEFAPVWAPDGRTIYYNANKTGAYLIYRKSAEGAGEAVPISTAHGLSQQPDDITPDGRLIVFEATAASTGADLLVLDTSGTKPPVSFLQTTAGERDARISPDGHWIAYLSDETGRDELYVQTFPTPGSKLQVSNDGAACPVWARDGKRLFFVAPDESLMAAEVTPGASLRVSSPAKLFRFPRPIAAFDVMPDGRRLMATMSVSDAAGRSIGIILDWDAARNQRAGSTRK